MKNVNFMLSEQTSLHQLQLNRMVYKDVKWLSSHNKTTRIWEMEDSHLINVMKNVAASLVASKTFPLIEDFKTYNGTSYHNYAQFLYNEFLFREAALEKQYMEYQIQEQHQRDRDYYDDRYDGMSWGDLNF